jgi:hypothetical protein
VTKRETRGVKRGKTGYTVGETRSKKEMEGKTQMERGRGEEPERERDREETHRETHICVGVYTKHGSDKGRMYKNDGSDKGRGTVGERQRGTEEEERDREKIEGKRETDRTGDRGEEIEG